MEKFQLESHEQLCYVTSATSAFFMQLRVASASSSSMWGCISAEAAADGRGRLGADFCIFTSRWILWTSQAIRIRTLVECKCRCGSESPHLRNKLIGMHPLKEHQTFIMYTYSMERCPLRTMLCLLLEGVPPPSFP